MPFADLSSFIDLLRTSGELHEVAAEVGADQEVAAITRRVTAAGGPALLFRRVRGFRYPVACNLFGTYGRMARALGLTRLEELTPFMERLLRDGFPDGESFRRYCAHEVDETFDVEEQPDLLSFPFLQNWPSDGGGTGRYITLPQICTVSPSGGRNCGMYRLQVLDGFRLAVGWHPGSGGERDFAAWRALKQRMPVAVVLGGDPALTMAAAAPLPEEWDEFHFAGVLRGEALPVTRCRTVPLVVPAGAEVVLEGYVDPDVTAEEGPFGNHTGRYAAARMAPVMTVTHIMRRHLPVIPATIVGPPPAEDCFIGKAWERLMLPLLRNEITQVVDISFPLEGIFHRAAVIAVSREGEHDAPRLVHLLERSRWLRGSPLVVLVDASVDPSAYGTVFWRCLNDGHARQGAENRMTVDATGWHTAATATSENPAIGELVKKRWHDYGF